MPRTPDPRTHETHDLELVAAYAAGDATGTDLEHASALVAGCSACAILHRDLRLIAAALPELPAPVRRRDFTLTEAQAAALRPAGWRAVLGTFATPRFRFATPLGTGLATLGIAGILLGTFAGTPLGTGGATSASASGNDSFTAAGGPQPATAPEAASPAASVAPADQKAALLGVSPAPAPTTVAGGVLGPVAPPTAGPLMASTAEPPARSTAGPVPYAADSAAGGASGLPLLVIAVGVLIVGIFLIGTRLVGRWVARAP